MAIDIRRMEVLRDFMSNDRELHVLRGQLISPVIITKKDGSGHYMGFRLKTIKQASDDEYLQMNNMYWILVSEEKCKRLGSALFKELTGQEVLVLVEVSNRVKSGDLKSPVYFNYVSYFLVDIMKTRDIKKDDIDF